MRQCPVDDFTLKPMEYEDVTVDVCLHCGGVWLDAGELEIIQKTQDSDFRGVPRSELDSVTAADGMAQSRGEGCLLYTSPSPRDLSTSRMPSSA